VCITHNETEIELVRLPALIDAYAAFDGRDRATIKHIARVIREGGLIPTTKRGSGASKMAEREVVNLLLGANGTEAAAEAALAAERLRTLRRSTYTLKLPKDLKEGWESEWAKFWQKFLSIGSFGDALEWIVCNAEQIAIFIRQLNRPHPEHDFHNGLRSHGSVYLGRTCAQFIVMDDSLPSVEISYRSDWKLDAGGFYGASSPYRRVSVEIDFAAILSLSRLVRGPNSRVDVERSSAAFASREA
jgi:hypothetical protein